ncbi:hypothetical protein C8J56DRAFT_848529 [Mycena floridula]|nr:hypothetical protein C8J56DRAFT_848529 [Mycena floridula]
MDGGRISAHYSSSEELHALDLTLLTNDSVLIHVDSSRLLAASANQFNTCILKGVPAIGPSTRAWIGRHRFTGLLESSIILKIIVHTLYGDSCASLSPTFQELVKAVNLFPLYGVQPKDHLASNQPMYLLLLTHVHSFALELYTLAASFDLHDLAVSCSNHLLSFPLSQMTDDMASLIEPIYLKRLFLLHLGRVDALKRLLLVSLPLPHEASQLCTLADQQRAVNAWFMVTSLLMSQARPDLSSISLEWDLTQSEAGIRCYFCKDVMEVRIKAVIADWLMVKSTI